MKKYLFVIAIVLILIILSIFLFNPHILLRQNTSAYKISNVTALNYKVSGNNYISQDVNFSFTSFFVPWNNSNLVVGQAYNSLIFIPVSANQTNPFQSYSSTYLQFIVNKTNLTLNKTLELFISEIQGINSSIPYTVNKLDIGGFNGFIIKILNNSILNTTYYAFTVTDNRIFSFLLHSGNYSIFRIANASFLNILKTVKINPTAAN